ncbi:MAG: DNA translocase FtsK, partial [Clostridia bacterium]|nr:DNA translocase FtsK [Clostridia bacterium]
MGLGVSEDAEYDELLPEAVKTVVNLNEASTSLLQRKMRLGYSRAARIMDEMEELGVIGSQNGSKRREVLMSYEEFEQMFMEDGK